MKSGVTRSLSPNQSGTTSGSPNTDMATSAIGVSGIPAIKPLSPAPSPGGTKRELVCMSWTYPIGRIFATRPGLTILGGMAKSGLSLPRTGSSPMKRHAAALLIVLLSAGCVHGTSMDQVHAGMTHEQVSAVMG